MIKGQISSLRLFFPFACLLTLLSLASVFSSQLGQLMRVAENPYDLTVFSLDQMLQLGSICLFALILIFVRTFPFKRIFKVTLAISAAALLGGWYLFPQTLFTYFFTAFFCPQVLPVLGWTYINQMMSKNEGIKYYFALSLFVGYATGLVDIAFKLASKAIVFFSHYSADLLPNYPALFVWSGIICLGLAGIFDRLIHNRLQEDEEEPTTTVVRNQWFDVLCLSVINCALILIYNLNYPNFIATVKELSLPQIYRNLLLVKFSAVIGIAIAALLLLSIFIGPQIVKKWGWKVAVIIAPAIAFIALCFAAVTGALWTLTLAQVIPIALHYAWIVPLMQIAFLRYAKKSRFSLQAWTCLVGSALIQFGADWVHFEPANWVFASSALLALMVASAFYLTKSESIA